MTESRNRAWLDALRAMLRNDDPDHTLREAQTEGGYTEGRSSAAGPNLQQIPRNAANNLGLGRGLNTEWARDALARGPRDPVRNYVEPMELSIDSFPFVDPQPTRRVIRRELQRVMAGVAIESLGRSGIASPEDVVVHALRTIGLGPLALEWLASLDDIGVQVDRAIATYTYHLCFSSYHPDFREVLEGGPRRDEILQQWARDRYAVPDDMTMREMQERIRQGSRSGTITRTSHGLQIRDANGVLRVSLGDMDALVNSTLAGEPIPFATNEGSPSVHVQPPEVPASSERRLRLNHKLRGKNDVAHDQHQSNQDTVPRRIARRRTGAKRPPRD